jgi:hypothetical protein
MTKIEAIAADNEIAQAMGVSLAAQWKTSALETGGPVERTQRKQGKSSLKTAHV